MTSGPQLERSLLETKERVELQTIANAMELKTSARASKATLIGAILGAAGVDAADTASTATVAEGADKKVAAATAISNGAPHDDAELVGVAVASTTTTNSSDEAVGTSQRTSRPQGQPSGQSQPGQSQPGQSQPGQSQFDPANRRNNRRRRGRDRERSDRDLQGAQEQTYTGELVEVRGLLDLRDEGYGFVRTVGYLPSPKDVYVSISQAKRFYLRKGDSIEGACRPAASNEKYPALLRIDSVSGLDPEEAKTRRRFEDLTPLFPDERLRLESEGDKEHDRADRRPAEPDRQGAARPHRVAAEGRQDRDPQAHRALDRGEQPRDAPHGAARRGAPRGGHRHASQREAARSSPRRSTGRARSTPRSPSSPSSARSGSSSSGATW